MGCEVDLLRKLVSIDTTSIERRNYAEIADLLMNEAERLGLNVEKVIDSKGIPHVLVSIPHAPEKARRIVFLAHYDVVPPGEGWSFNPFEPFVEGDKLFGRGAADDKSGIAAAMAAFHEVMKERLELKVYPVLAAVGGEETGESEEFLKSLDGDLCVVLDVVGCETLSIGASGAVVFTVIVKGKQAHSAYPFKGKNAIYEANRIVGFLEEKGRKFEETVTSRFPASFYYDRLPRRMHVTMIQGGIAQNVIPGECALKVNVRTIPEESAEKVALEIKDMLESFAKENGIALEVKLERVMDGWFTDKEEVIERFKGILEDIIGKPVRVSVELGGTDGRHFIGRMPVIQYGAIREDTNFHGKNEFVYLEDLKTLKNFIKRVLTTQI